MGRNKRNIVMDNNEDLDTRLPRAQPDIAIEWRDVEIEIKYCGPYSDSQDQSYTSLFPSLNTDLISAGDLDRRKATKREKRKKELESKKVEKLDCHFCNKSFHRKSSLHHHLLNHNRSKEI